MINVSSFYKHKQEILGQKETHMADIVSLSKGVHVICQKLSQMIPYLWLVTK